MKTLQGIIDHHEEMVRTCSECLGDEPKHNDGYKVFLRERNFHRRAIKCLKALEHPPKKP